MQPDYEELFDIDLMADFTPYAGNRSIWYVGVSIDIEDGISRFYGHLDKNGLILIGKPEIYDYLWCDQVLYLIFYKSLEKLEYLEYMWEKKQSK